MNTNVPTLESTHTPNDREKRIFDALGKELTPDNLRALHESENDLQQWHSLLLQRWDVKLRPEIVHKYFGIIGAAISGRSIQLTHEIKQGISEKIERCFQLFEELSTPEISAKEFARVRGKIDTVVADALTNDFSRIPAFSSITNPADKIVFLTRVLFRALSVTGVPEAIRNNTSGAFLQVFCTLTLDDHIDDPASAIAEIFPTENPINIDAQLSTHALACVEQKYQGDLCTLQEVIRLMRRSNPKTYEALVMVCSNFFFSKGFSFGQSPETKEHNDAKLYELFIEASTLRSLIKKRPRTNIPPLDCTELLREYAHESPHLRLEHAILRPSWASDEFEMSITFMRTSDQMLFGAIQFDGPTSFKRTKDKITRLWPDNFSFDHKTRTIRSISDPWIIKVNNLDSIVPRQSSSDMVSERISYTTIEIVMLRAIAKYLSRENNGRAIHPDTHSSKTTPAIGDRKPIKISPNEPIRFDRTFNASEDVSGDENTSDSLRRNFGRRAALVTLPEGSKPSRDAFERCQSVGIDLYAYLYPKTSQSDTPSRAFHLDVPKEGLPFLISHLPYEQALEQSHRLVNMYGGPGSAWVRITTYRRETPAPEMK